jgi:hypothetical protein
MSNDFAGYGDIKPVNVNEWRCPKDGVSMDWIEARTIEFLENFIVVDTVYMSEDVYTQFMQSLGSRQVYKAVQVPIPGPHVTSVMTSGGSMTIKMVPGFTDFCHIGTNATYNDLVRVQIDEAFEKTVLKNCERE